MNPISARSYGSKAILSLAVPAIVSNLAVPLLGLSDTAITGHLGDAGYLAAIAVGAMMFNMVFWLFACLRMSTTGLTARAFGRNSEAAPRVFLAQSLTLSLVIGALIMLLRRPIAWLLLKIIAPDADVASAASGYFMITSLCSPAVLAQMALCGWFIGMQNTVFPMVVTIVTASLNILLSLSLVIIFGYGFAGVAWGTFWANWTGLALSLVLVLRYGGVRVFSGFASGSVFNGVGRFFRVNTDLFLRSGCLMAVTLAMTSFGARLGAMVLAVNVVLMQFFHLFSYFSDGFAFAAEAITGRLAGAGECRALRRGTANLLLWGGGVALFFTAVYAVFASPATALLTSDPGVRAGVGDMMIWVILIPGLTIGAFIFDGICIGLAATRQMLLAACLSAVIFFAVSFPYGGCVTSNMRLWCAFMSYLVGRGLILGLLTPRMLRKCSAEAPTG